MYGADMSQVLSYLFDPVQEIYRYGVVYGEGCASRRRAACKLLFSEPERDPSYLDGTGQTDYNGTNEELFQLLPGVRTGIKASWTCFWLTLTAELRIQRLFNVPQTFPCLHSP